MYEVPADQWIVHMILIKWILFQISLGQIILAQSSRGSEIMLSCSNKISLSNMAISYAHGTD